MFEFDEQQLRALSERDERAYLERVRERLLAQFPDLLADDTLSERLLRAMHVARSWGLDEDALLLAFLSGEAVAPGFYLRPATRAWLTRPGHTIGQRLAEYLSVLRWSAGLQAAQAQT